ncbi:MAG: rod shape-determining protein MreD [Novosphingobium sp.]
MIQSRLPRQVSDPFRKTLNRAPSPFIAIALPWVTVMLGSLSPTWPVIASAPMLPPLGFLILLVWRQLRPGLLPVWAGLPLGLFDDLYSGQPLGSAILLWSIALIVLEVIELRFPWRNFLIDWLVAAGLIGAYLPTAMGLAQGLAPSPLVLAPQLLTSIFAYPLVGRLVALFDRLRLLHFRALD